MINQRIKTRASWFINEEMERVMGDLESGIISKDQAVGSLNTLFNISSGIEDVKHMQTICRIISYIRSTNQYYQLKKMYLGNYFHEAAAEDTKDII